MTNKIALITGGSRGLGKSMALHLAKEGRDVIVTYHSNQKDADAVVSEIKMLGRKAVALKLDSSNTKTFAAFSDEVKSVLKQTFGRDHFDFLINNAGTGLGAAFNETTEEQFDELMNIHFKGVFFLTQKLLPQIADGGRILNISTGLTRFTSPGYSAYASMKGAMETLTLYLAKELGPRKISVNILAPGAIETDFRGGAIKNNPEIKKHLAGVTSLGRVGLPDDIGGAVSALLGDGTHWITGQRIEASGGMFL